MRWEYDTDYSTRYGKPSWNLYDDEHNSKDDPGGYLGWIMLDGPGVWGVYAKNYEEPDLHAIHFSTEKEARQFVIAHAVLARMNT